MTDKAIARLFAKADKQRAALACTEAAIRAARPLYAANHGLRCYPSLDVMRRECRS